MAIKIEALTDLGKRKTNQDSFLVMNFRSGDSECIVAGVADGVGSFKDSEYASKFLTTRLQKWFNDFGEGAFKGSFEGIEHAVYNAILNIHDEMRYLEMAKGMEFGTTLTLLIVIENSYMVFQVGDSRCYSMCDGIVRMITRDQTVAEKEKHKAGNKGEMLPGADEETKDSTILQCIGKGTMQPDVYSGVLSPGFKLLVNTDGLTNNIHNSEIFEHLSQTQTTKHKLEDLIATARSKGEKDNITAILIESM